MARARAWAELRQEMVSSPARSVGTLYRGFQAAANQGYAARGWAGVTLSHVQFLSEIEEKGTRLSDVAAALKTTKQYAGKLARDVASKRLATLGADPLDARAVLAKPTERGRAFLQDACEVRAELESALLGRLSPSRAAAFLAALDDLVDATHTLE
jgi:DNA-binding MarR family transcriptional regulator